jgi:hypothetical protein
MAENKVIAINQHVRTSQLERFVSLTDLRKRPLAAQAVHEELVRRQLEGRKAA